MKTPHCPHCNVDGIPAGEQVLEFPTGFGTFLWTGHIFRCGNYPGCNLVWIQAPEVGPADDAEFEEIEDEPSTVDAP